MICQRARLQYLPTSKTSVSANEQDFSICQRARLRYLPTSKTSVSANEQDFGICQRARLRYLPTSKTSVKQNIEESFIFLHMCITVTAMPHNIYSMSMQPICSLNLTVHYNGYLTCIIFENVTERDLSNMFGVREVPG